jgi:hypothetical protein
MWLSRHRVTSVRLWLVADVEDEEQPLGRV